MSNGTHAATSGEWIDETLLAGPDHEVLLGLDRPIDRAALRGAVAERQSLLVAAGLRAGGTVALRLPPSLAFVANLLASWRCGAQAILIDHRLTTAEVDRILDRLRPQLLVEPDGPVSAQLRGFVEPAERIVPRTGAPAESAHCLVQFSSGSTGPSKVIGRTAEDLIAETERYTRIEDMPRRGERLVLLNSLIHTFGLVGGLLHGLHAGVQLVLPGRMTGGGILAALGAGSEPTTLFGVPFHYELLATLADPPPLPHLVAAVSGGELIRPDVSAAFGERFRVPVGECYGMTETGVIAMDVAARHRPSAGRPAPGVRVRAQDGELLVALEHSPYLGAADPSRWHDGWLHTRDAAELDERGVVTLRGRLDSQVSVGGLSVDLNEVEQFLAALPGVTEAVVVHDDGIEAYLALAGTATLDEVEAALAQRLAPFKRPRLLHGVSGLPRTSTGKRVRDVAVLRAAVAPARHR
ncbi:class I adenylate-forming enzyme family protein [Streptacidiphilus sp. EB129]|uniref:class I adenylate-forming enzyme family protein n=1 Tax=Streptacidiphilus sp. EB129 TaxID=3156262 RepID=UPI00351933DB